MAVDIERLRELDKISNDPGHMRHIYNTEPAVHAQLTVYKTYRDLLGRDPTPEEFGIYAPIAMNQGGFTAVSEISKKVDADKNSPEALDKKRRDELAGKAPEYYGSVDQVFRSTMGREASQQERDHFGRLLASGEVDEYTMGQWLQAMPESVRKQDEAFRSQLRGELADSDKRYMTESVLPAVQAKFAQQGRSLDSTGFSSAIANAAQSQNVDRERYLSNLAADMYSGRSGQAREDYTTSRDRSSGLQDYYRTSRDASNLYNRQRYDTLADYDIQRKTYEDYLRRYGNRGGGWVNNIATGLDMANSATNLFKGWGK